LLSSLGNKMKPYGIKRKDTCQCCNDIGCIGRKFRLIRGKSRKHRKNALKVPKSALRFEVRIALHSNYKNC
jgi:hypothetical protein